MAPRKAKSQGKRNNIKIKSKINTQKRGIKPMKKNTVGDKPLDNLKWINTLGTDGAAKKCDAVPAWLDGCVYKHGMAACSSEDNSSEYADYGPKDAEEKSSSSDASEECNCPHPKYSDNKCGILKRKLSSTNSLVAKYIKSGMDHVASFIVESAIRFGEQHGVVVPDKNTPNLYEITSPDKRFEEKCRKIRFKIPDKTLGYEEAKKAMWRSHLRGDPSEGTFTRDQVPMDWEGTRSNSTSWGSTSDSLEEILPLLERLKEGGKIVNSELDLEELMRASPEKEHPRKKERERERDRERDRVETAGRRERERERGKERFRSMGKRYKSVGAVSDKASEDGNYPQSGQPVWKRFKRDSLELGRQRLRAATCPRKPKSVSRSPY